MELSFGGRTALVTGASRGIGLRVAQDLDRAGAEVIVTSTHDHDDRFEAAGLGHCRRWTVDFLDSMSRRAFIDDICALPSLDVLINNAGTTRHGPMAEATEEEWDETHDVNLKAPFLVTQAAAEVMRPARYGRIVNIGSIWSHITMPGRSVYSATKFGLRGLTISQAVELAADNIFVNVVAPGFTLTDMVRKNYSAEALEELCARIPAGRLAEPADVSRAVLFLASEVNSYITGQSLIVDGGYSLM